MVGAAKAATTTLHAILDQHPEVYCPLLKEPGFFADDDAPRMFDPFSGKAPFDGVSYVRGSMAHHEQVAYIKDAKVYQQLYRRVGNEKAIGDFSTAYLCSINAARKIREFNPKAKIIVMLREPVERALSHYKMDRAIGLVTASFGKSVQAELAALSDSKIHAHWYIRIGLYAAQVERYIKEFPKEQLKVVLYEDFCQAREQTISDIETFLDISHCVSHLDLNVNRSEKPRSQGLVKVIEKMNVRRMIRKSAPRFLIDLGKKVLYKPYTSEMIAKPEDITRLREVFAPDVKRLSTLLDRDLSLWRMSM